MNTRGLILGFSIVLAFFFWFAGNGVRGGFMPDDLMNIYQAWQKPAPQLAAEFIPFHQPSDRPLGALAYKLLHHAAGLNPRPYRIFCFTLLLANLFLLFEVARRISGSAEAALLAALLGCYNAYCSDLYYSSGTLYDLLCFLFYWGALALYLRWRRSGDPTWPQTALWCGLFLLALDAKEIAVSLPVVIVFYEVLFRRGDRSWKVPMIGVTIAAAAAASKLLAPGALAQNAAYQLEFSSTRILGNLAGYWNLILYRGEQIKPLGAVAILAGLLASALLARSRAALWGWLVFVTASLPVLLIPGRSLYALDVPLLGIWLLAAALLVHAAEWLAPAWRWRCAALFLATLFVLQHYHRWIQPYALAWLDHDYPRVTVALDGMRDTMPQLPKGARLVFLEDPHPADDYILTFAARLFYNDPSIEVLRPKQLGREMSREDLSSATHVLRLTEQKLTLVR
jgi:hypothetical protein